jgi:transcriptional regulator with XRE-family HTH domain
LTGKTVATQVGWSEAKLSRIENGQARVKLADLYEIMDLYEVPDSHRAELVALAEESRGADPLEELEGDLPPGHARILQIESEAQSMWSWEPQVIPGLLQVEDYTQALLHLWSAIFAMPAAAIERRVETRQVRQRVLTRTPPLELSFVIDESVLYRAFAAPSTMRTQLTHLAEISHHPNVELRILPLAGNQVIGTGAFNYFRFPRTYGVSLPDTVAFEHLQGTTSTEAEGDVNTYQVVFDALRANSLNPDDSRAMLARVALDTWQ